MATEEKILDSALKLARAHGYGNLTLEGIAAGAGVGKTSIYRRFTSKAQVLAAALSRQGEVTVQFADSGDLAVDLTGGLQQVAARLRGEDGALVAALFAEAQLDLTFKPQLVAFLTERRTGARERLQVAVQKGELTAACGVEFLLDQLYGPLMYRHLTGLGPVNDAFVEQLVLRVLCGAK